MLIDWLRYRVRLGVVGRSNWGDPLIPHERLWNEVGRLSSYDLWFIWQGQGQVRLATGWTPLRTGHCLWMRPGREYPVKTDPAHPFQLNFVHFELLATSGRKSPRQLACPPEIITLADLEFVELLTNRLVELVVGLEPASYNTAAPGSREELLGTAMLTDLLMHLDDASSQPRPAGTPALSSAVDRRIRSVALRIVERPADAHYVDTLARAFGCGRSRFAVLFKQVIGHSPTTFIIQTRIHRAERLLRETPRPIGEIAEACGYRDVYFFSRQFKQITGQTPSAYRADASETLGVQSIASP